MESTEDGQGEAKYTPTQSHTQDHRLPVLTLSSHTHKENDMDEFETAIWVAWSLGTGGLIIGVILMYCYAARGNGDDD